MLRGRELKYFVGEIMREIAGLQDQLTRIDLRSEDGVSAAIELQGRVKGMTRVLDLVIELTIEEEEDDGGN
jgi:hypothetical protein